MSTPSVVLTIIVPLIGVVVYLLPAPFEPVGFELQSPPYLGDALPVNDHLQRAEKILENQVLGPESLVFKDGDIYSGTADGKIIKINSNLELTNVLSLGSVYCGNEIECGRPLGLRFTKDGLLYIIDAHLGLFHVNVSTGERTRLVSGGTIVDGKPIVFFNDLAVRSDGMVYFTHSSTKWHRFQHVSLAMEGNNDSRLLQFDPTSGEVSVLMDGLTLGNGVQLSQDESFLLVAEGGRMRIHQYFLTSSREGEREIFADNLPGFVDNIRPSSSGGFWVALPTIRRHCLYDVFAPRPWLRKFLIKFFSPEFIVKSTTKPYGLVMEFAEDGHIVRRLDDPTGAVVSYISEVLDTGSSLYLGSYTSPFLAKLSLE
ncbi:adipocyte plasma membrane-associated protein isoform X1 [Strongylocentrotus purpuratus]|uniref:Strictosidine synthase conserved region domain-containing protein n=1 Tax=Strongylocentrotus purpuratus TaxID=7668 RepID=A0A7M7PPZ9_STRPU|nr:adipocyte plasma membrane-associated protein isoform X1 [Strongylocentrotus purpuratus]